MEYSLALHHISDGKLLDLRLAMPVPDSAVDQRGNQVNRWKCSFTVDFDGEISSRTVYSETWIGALVMALEGLRLFIPEDEEKNWETDEGLPSWLVFPKTIPVGLGYAEHHRLWRMIVHEEKSLEGEADGVG